MNVLVNGVSYKAVKTGECDEKYTEYNVFSSDVLVGRVTRYGAEIYYSAWVDDDDAVAVEPTVRDAVRELVNHYLNNKK